MSNRKALPAVMIRSNSRWRIVFALERFLDFPSCAHGFANSSTTRGNEFAYVDAASYPLIRCAQAAPRACATWALSTRLLDA